MSNLGATAGKKVVELLLAINTKGAKKNLKEVDEGLKGVGAAGKIAGKGFNMMGTAIKAAGIGIIVGLFAQLYEQLQKNQKFMDAMNKVFMALEPILIAVAEVIAVLVEGIADLIGASLDAISGTKNMTDSLIEQRKEVELLEAELGLLQLQYQKEAELMRQIRDDESLSIQERINANHELGKVLEEQLQHERSIAIESLNLAEIELARNKDNVELQVSLLEAKTKLAEIDERITGQRSEQLVNLNSLERERQAQQKENARIREQQLQQEAKMLQDLIDLQNEDIKVKKKANRDLTTQFENAEEANAELIKQKKEQMQAELNALDASVENAKTNIELQKEQTQSYKDEIDERSKSDTEIAKQNEKIIKDELKLFSDSEKVFDIAFTNSTKRDKDALAQKTKFNELMSNSNLQSIEDVDAFIEKVKEEQVEIIAYMETSERYNDGQVKAIEGRFDVQLDLLETYRSNIERKLVDTSDTINSITEEQILNSEQSAKASENIINNAAQNKIEIEQRYAKEIEEIETSLGETKQTLQEQADDELFLHFETAQEKEIRLVEEKYDKLIGLAQGNVEATLELEKQKEDALTEINQRETKQLIKNFQEQMKLRKAKAKAEKELQQQVGLETLQMGMDLAKEGTATFKAIASAETIMATYMGATKALANVPPPFNFVQAGLIIATGIKNLAEISKTQVPGGGGGGTDTMPDTVTDVGGDMTGDVPAITFGAAGSDVPPVQAYVVETDISNAQALQSELDLQSTL